MARARAVKLDPWAKNYRAFIDRLQKLGATWCPTCYAYLAVTHDCRAFGPVYLPAPLEAYAFAADPPGN